MKPGERQAWKMIRSARPEIETEESSESPHNETQEIIDHMERPYGDEDWEMSNGGFDDWYDWEGE